jgi:hypothetical protein
VDVTFFRYERLKKARVTPVPDKRDVARFALLPRASKAAKAIRRRWLGSATI